MLRGRNIEFAVLDSLRIGEFIRDFAYQANRSFEKYHFQAAVVVYMDMCRGDDLVVVMMLDLCELVLEVTFVMVVHERKHSNCEGRGVTGFFFENARTNQVPEGLRTVGYSFLMNQLVEPFEKVGFDGYAKASDAFH